MTEEKNSKALKALTAILAIGIIALGVYTIRFYIENQKQITRLEDEKLNLENDLNNLIVKYDTAIAENDVMAKDLFEAKRRIESLLDSIKGLDKTNFAVISNFKNQIKRLEKEKELLFKTVDSLSTQNTRLANAIKNSNNELQEKINYADSLKEENQILNTKVAEGSRLQIAKLLGEGISIKNSGDIVNTKRHRRVDNIRTCFTVLKNALSKRGEHIFYIQVINPKNNILGKNNSETFGEDILIYSESTSVFYENETVDVCILIDSNQNKIISGNYTVNVFSDSNILASTTFTLK